MYGILLSIFYAIVKTTFKTVAQWVATKTFFTTLLLIAFPIVLNNFLGKFLEKILTKVSESITSGTGDISSITYNFTGLSAFFINLPLVYKKSTLSQNISDSDTLFFDR